MEGDSPFADPIGWIHTNLDAPPDVPSLAARADLSESSFHRKFVAATGETPARFVEAARLMRRECCFRAGRHSPTHDGKPSISGDVAKIL